MDWRWLKSTTARNSGRKKSAANGAGEEGRAGALGGHTIMPVTG